MKREDLEELNKLFKELDKLNKELQLIDNDCNYIKFESKRNSLRVYKDSHPEKFEGLKEKLKEFFLEQREEVVSEIRAIDTELVAEYD